MMETMQEKPSSCKETNSEFMLGILCSGYKCYKKYPITSYFFKPFENVEVFGKSHEFERLEMRSVTTFHKRKLLCFNNDRYDIQVESGVRYLGDGRLIDTACESRLIIASDSFNKHKDKVSSGKIMVEDIKALVAAL